MKLGSLFDGSGGFPLAARINGISTAWTSEIEDFPMKVSAKNFPDAVQLGDITKIDGSKVEAVDIISFGSPCQDMSLAGGRKGLKHSEHGSEETTRSGLFYEAIRIIEEMRKQTNGRYPRYAVWENVAGAFSSNNGEDFRAVLEAFVGVAEKDAPLLPKPDRWQWSGQIMGDRFSVAWRTLDAQYWGVPQRRKRIYLVADFVGRGAPEILFDVKGCRRDFEESGTKGEETPGHVKESTDGSGPRLYDNHPQDSRVTECRDNAPTVTSYYGNSPCNLPIVMNQIGGTGELVSETDKAYTLKACQNKSPEVVCYAAGKGSFFKQWQEGKAVTLVATDYKDPQAVCYCVDQGGGESSVSVTKDLAPTLCTTRAGEPVINQQYIVRRLTPTECARLQGFPDDWAKDVEGYLDSKEYKLWGNGIALPCAEFVLGRIAEHAKIQGCY